MMRCAILDATCGTGKSVMKNDSTTPRAAEAAKTGIRNYSSTGRWFATQLIVFGIQYGRLFDEIHVRNTSWDDDCRREAGKMKSRA